MKFVTHSLLHDLAVKAAGLPRRRAHYNLHAGPEDPLQRFLVVARGDSYFDPHRHTTRSELATMISGCVDLLTFDDEGRVLERTSIGEGAETIAYETPALVWHTLVPRTEICAFLEVKLGPYDPARSAEVAPWAPGKGGAGSWGFRAWLHHAQPGDRWGEEQRVSA